MSRLVNPGAGDVYDRLTILALKILFGTEQGKDTAHWETERSQLLPKLSSGAIAEAVLDLAAVNAALWHAEDDLRDMRSPKDSFGPKALDTIRVLAFRIQALNDRRAALIHQINDAAGDNRGQEKFTP